jgi:hypothetical protein
MFSYTRRGLLVATLILLSFMLPRPGAPPITVQPAYAGTGPLITVPPSAVAPALDGGCDAGEYTDANQVQITVRNVETFTIYLKHTADDLYICFSSPPAGLSDYVSVYIDRDDNGGNGDDDDFLISVPYDGIPSAGSWDSASFTYSGADPGGWSALQQHYGAEIRDWDAEFRIARRTLGGWSRTVGLALSYTNVIAGANIEFPYGWPTTYVYGNPELWGNARLLADPSREIEIGHSSTAPTANGNCGLSTEYADATDVSFSTGSSRTIDVYLKHTTADLFVCMQFLEVPSPATRDLGNAAIFINRNGAGGDAPGPDDLAFTISYSGIVSAHRGSGFGYNGPDPGGYTISRFILYDLNLNAIAWSAEFRISGATLGGGWGRDISIAFGQQAAGFVGDDSGWPADYGVDTPSTWGVGRLTAVPAITDYDMRPTGIEVTQAIQDLSNNVDLVANKRTFVRVYSSANANRSDVRVTARLYGFRDGLSLGFPLLPANAGDTINMVTTANRALLGDSLLFELPLSWIQAGTITLRATINPFHDIVETDYSNNSISTTSLTFQTVPVLMLRIVNYEYRRNGALISISDVDQDMLESYLRRMYPISRLNSSRLTVIDDQISNTPNADRVNSGLRWVRDTYEGGNPGVIYYGMVSSDGGGGFMSGKAADIPSWEAAGPTGTPRSGANPSNASAWDVDGTYGDWYGAHEIGHMLGQPHAEFCGANDGESYPYPNGIIGGPVGDTTRFFGFDVGDAGLGLTMGPVPNTWTDMMSYCPNEWVSDHTYTRLRNYIQGHFTASARQRDFADQPYMSGDFLSIYGTIHFSSQIATLPFVSRQAQVGELPPLVPGPYHIRLFDASGVLLADYAFTPLADTEPDVGSIHQIVNFVPDTRRIAIYSDVSGREIASRTVSANAPAVTSVSHTGGPELAASGPVTLTWDGSDLDGDSLTYTVLYSFDNRNTWRALTLMSTNNGITFDSSQLEGTAGARTGYFRVVVNDGVLTGYADDGPFSVAGKAPIARIANPDDGSTYGYGQTVALEGQGQDFEDSTLEDASLSWTSSLDGFLGTGHLLHPSLLSAGSHIITLTATDSDGQIGTATVVVEIAAVSSHPSPTLSAGPTPMLWLDEAGGTNPAPQILSIRNLGTGPLNWTATSDSAWATLSSSSGTAPSEISVSVDTSGFLTGTLHVAHITLTSTEDPANSSRTITAMVQMMGAPANLIYLPLINR